MVKSKKLPKESAVKKLKEQDRVLNKLPDEKTAEKEFQKGEGLLKRWLRKARIRAPTKKQHDRSLK